MILPARTRVTETPAGTLHEWTLLDGGAPGPALRLLLGEGVSPLLRSRLLDRLGIDGGRHDVVAIELDAEDDRPI